MKKYKIELTGVAHEDLEDIVIYIAKELKEPTIAQKLHTKIVTEIKKLRVMPERHEMAIDTHLKSLDVRKFYVDNYIVPYTILYDTNTVQILRVLYARRDWKNLL
ncbi:addiction module toxin RelE [Clostridia bacterium]|nr:addiction module toxin RelE [Clostridia bacterium]